MRFGDSVRMFIYSPVVCSCSFSCTVYVSAERKCLVLQVPLLWFHFHFHFLIGCSSSHIRGIKERQKTNGREFSEKDNNRFFSVFIRSSFRREVTSRSGRGKASSGTGEESFFRRLRRTKGRVVVSRLKLKGKGNNALLTACLSLFYL